MKIAAPKNANYAAQVVRIKTVVELAGLDNLVGVPVLGYQALTTRGIEAGELRLAFTAETALSEAYASNNDLYRDETRNKGGDKGYLEPNARVRALKMRGHVSNALLMPVSSLDYTGAKWWELEEGDTFDSINGHDICQKYVVPVKQGSRPASKLEKAFKRVTSQQFPEHLDTDNYWRNKHLLKPGQEVVVTQKLHGSSIRVGNVPVLRQKGRVEKFLNRWFPTADHEYDVVYGSRKVIKDESNAAQGFYKSDIWVEYGKRIAELIPEGYLLYGELIGFTPDGTPIQKGYTYNVAPGQMELYVYRVAHVNRHGNMADLSWDGVKEFCTARGLKWTPELQRLPIDVDLEGEEESTSSIDSFWERMADRRYTDVSDTEWDYWPGWTDKPLPLSHKFSVDEGIVVRQEGLVPTLLKLKSPVFLEHETKLLDKGEEDIESQEAA